MEKKKTLKTGDLLDINVSEGWIYYRDYQADSTIWKMHIDGSKTTQINKEKSFELLLDGQWCYWKDKNGLYKTKVDGSETIGLVDGTVGLFNVADEWVYYGGEDNIGLYKIRTDGTQQQKISENACGLMYILGDYIYYRVDPTGFYLTSPLYRMKTDGTEQMQFSK